MYIVLYVQNYLFCVFQQSMFINRFSELSMYLRFFFEKRFVFFVLNIYLIYSKSVQRVTHVFILFLKSQKSEFRQIAADLVENVPLFTRSGSFRILQSLCTVVEHLPEISPMVSFPQIHSVKSSTLVDINVHNLLQKEKNLERGLGGGGFCYNDYKQSICMYITWNLNHRNQRNLNTLFSCPIKLH